MPIRRKITSPTRPDAPAGFIVPRGWMITLVVLIVVPWLIAGAVFLWHLRAETISADSVAPEPSPAITANPGPWGKLISAPIVISPPTEFIAENWARSPNAGKNWFFPSTRPDEAAAFLSSTGLAADQVSQLMSGARRDPAINGVVFTPDPALVRNMPPDVRSRIYLQLAKSALNEDQVDSFRYAGDSAQDWLGRSPLSPETRGIIDPLLYRVGQHLFFSDQAVAWSQIHDPEELRRLAKALLRQKTLRVRLSMQQLSEVAELTEYWGRGGRRTDIRPLLESIVEAGGDRTLDIVHLLPSFARERLYRYQQVTGEDLMRPYLANCLWTALNFFNPTPDNRYLDVNYSMERLKQDYYIVENGFELGDIIAFVDEHESLFHMVVYLADNLVFTKNGKSRVAPWVILPLDVVKDCYRPRCANPTLVYHRRKDF